MIKSSQLKSLIKEAVREAIQEEIKDILLEAVKSPQVVQPSPQIQIENTQPSTPTMSPEARRAMYSQMINGSQPITSQQVSSFNVSGPVDTINGQLPAGEVGMDQIQNLLNSK